MVPPSEFVQWYYLIYLLPGGVALLLLLLSALGGGIRHHPVGAGHGGGHGGGHHGFGHHHGHAPAHAPAQGNARHSPRLAVSGREPQTLLTFFGWGRVPAPLVWGSALLGWGLFGFWGTQFWQTLLPLPAVFFLPSLATALAGAFVTEKVTVEAASRLLPRDESYATGQVELCGLTGTVAFPVDAGRGRVHIYDAYGTMHDVSAWTAPGQPTIARGRTVLVIDYDAAQDRVIVEETG